jgi:hypothetical protein
LKVGAIPKEHDVWFMEGLNFGGLDMAGLSLLDHFSALRDPRQPGNAVYPLPEIMFLVLCATLAGAEDFVEVRHWGARSCPFCAQCCPTPAESRPMTRSTM